MRALIQRVTRAAVTVDSKITGEIGKGLVVLLGVTNTDSAAQAAMLAEKTVNLRIFSDAAGKFNLSALEVGAELLAISQFTLYADCRRGRRPGFTDAAPPVISEPMYEKFVQLLQDTGLKVATGIFGANMLVSIYNDGPVTIMLDSDEKR